MPKVRKAVIPAAGLGTRFLPATKAMPKEMLPIVDKPTIQYIVEEAAAAGIEDILIVTGKGKRAIEDHFDRSVELEELLTHRDKRSQLAEIRQIGSLANIHYIRQKEPLGLGHAVWCARRFVGNEPFAVLLGDDIVNAHTPCIRQLMDVYETYEMPVVGVQNVPEEAVSRYGIVGSMPMGTSRRLSQIREMVEKPQPYEAPSNLAIIGRYVLTPDVFDVLELGQIGAGGEIQLTDALVEVNKKQGMIACEFEGRRYDVGEKLGFIEATLELALGRKELRTELQAMMRRMMTAEELVVG